ncbi:MAG: radical SAM family heme chaperone HemW [Solitalea-like symbiont of Acarus siro]
MLSYNHKNEASLYIHIPFCKSACSYCNFNFSTMLQYKHQVVNSIVKEIIQKAYLLTNSYVKTIYLGGGTPSILNDNEIHLILNALFKNYNINANAEITLEANPENLTIEKLRFIKSLSINRLSVGIQSFYDEDLKFMNRCHRSNDAIKSVTNAKKIGIDNVSIDLIYGYLLLSSQKLKSNILLAQDLDVNHISTYALTIENKTLFAYRTNRNSEKIVSDETFSKHFDIMQYYLSNKFIQYEISNWAKDPEFISKHNCSYWSLNDYIGIGPSAHSFINNTRSWNEANNHNYMNLVNNNLSPTAGSEVLSHKDSMNEYIMLALRT